MKLGIVITTFNRPEYLEQCFESLRRAIIPEGTAIIIVDDASTDKKTTELIETNGLGAYRDFNKKNSGICTSLKKGFEWLFGACECDVVMNLDADAIVRNDFIDVLLKLQTRFPDQIITGFNCQTKNKDGSERHKIISTGDNYNTKKSVGGINMMFNKSVYEKYVLPALETNLKKGGNWDHMACITSEKDKKSIICSVPSVVQHIGIHSSMGHTTSEAPDTADDFKPLHLSDVTLIGVDCMDVDRLVEAADKCMGNISFGDVKLLSSIVSQNKNVWPVKPIRSVAAYSEFIIKQIHKYVKTSHMLIIQHDGYVMNYKSWDKRWLNYDYIGGAWWYKDGMNVGNGGFSLRSKRLMEIMSADDHIKIFHPEDHHIGRTYRKYLEKRHQIKFAPEEEANKFSIDGYNKQNKLWSGQFGFHGNDIRLPQSHHAPRAIKNKPPLIISQFQGLGDILFAMPLINDWIKEGHKIIWPVVSHYTALNKHFPLVNFIDMDLLQVDYNRKEEYETGGCKVIPLRWSEHILKLHYRDVMKAKYLLYKKDWKRWRELKWVRDTVNEEKLFKELDIKPGEKYNLVNYHFRTDQTGRVKVDIRNHYRTIELKNIPGYTLMDWGKAIEHAAEIHTPGTSINYILEVLEVKADMHLYVRRPEEKDFSLYDYLLTKKYIYHFK